MSYWVYQHLGNLSPRELAEDATLRRIEAGEPAGPLVRALAERGDRDPAAARWSFVRDLGGSRLVAIDSRAGRVLAPERRMLDAHDWEYVERGARGDCDHVLLATSVPWLLADGMHNLEQWNERVCDGAWGETAARLGERVRQGLDLEHWAAFDRSFRDLGELARAVATGERGAPPASVVALSGDVHHAYLYEVGFRRRADRARPRVPVYQAVCSPVRNALSRRERRVIRMGQTRGFAAVTRALARAAGARDQNLRWRPPDGEGPWFSNQLGTLELDGRRAVMRLEQPIPAVAGPPRLERLFERRLS